VRRYGSAVLGVNGRAGEETFDGDGGGGGQSNGSTMFGETSGKEPRSKGRVSEKLLML
jgi:hypothetical protein